MKHMLFACRVEVMITLGIHAAFAVLVPAHVRQQQAT